jgi:hypothetical protein
MNVKMMTLNEIRYIGLEALSRELGPVGLIRFLQQFETGRGDYTRERHAWLDQIEIKDIVQGIQAARLEASETSTPTA